jgi:DNA invertase Pin-like site-specific DNA recombinase
MTSGEQQHTNSASFSVHPHRTEGTPAMTAAAASASAAIYVRRSAADAAGSERSGRSLAQQEAEARDLAHRLGLEVVAVYAEREGTGASARSRKARPQWLAALRDLDEGTTFRTLIVWALDRADRRGAVEVGRLLDAHADGSRRIVGVDGTDTGDPRRRLETIIRAEMARDEAERLAVRVSRAKRFARSEGRWLGGRPPLGLRVEGGQLTRDPETYPVARRIAEALLKGSSLWRVAQDLNADGVPSPRGGAWAVGTVAQLVKAPSFAGLQSVRRRTASGGWAATGEVYMENGEPVSVGEGVITPAERSRILAALDSRSVETGRRNAVGDAARRGRREVRSLLGDVLRCGTCGGRVAQSGTADRRSYRCAAMARGKGCAGFTAPTSGTDEAIVTALLHRLVSLEPGDGLLEEVGHRWTARVAPEAVAQQEEARAALAAAEADLARVRDLVAAGTFDLEDAAAVMPRLRERVNAARANLSAVPAVVADVTPLLDLAQSRPAWDSLPLEERRALVGLAVEEVHVSPAKGRGYRFSARDRLNVKWTDGTTTRGADAWPDVSFHLDAVA